MRAGRGSSPTTIDDYLSTRRNSSKNESQQVSHLLRTTDIVGQSNNIDYTKLCLRSLRSSSDYCGCDGMWEREETERELGLGGCRQISGRCLAYLMFKVDSARFSKFRSPVKRSGKRALFLWFTHRVILQFKLINSFEEGYCRAVRWRWSAEE